MSQTKTKKYSGRKKQPALWPMIMLVSGGVLLVFGILFAFNRPSKPKAALEVSGSPSLKVDQDKVDLGDVKLNKTVEVSFQLTNVGDQTLRFNKEPYIDVVEGC